MLALQLPFVGPMEGSLNELELFAGAGGGILGSMLLGHRCVCAVEFNAYARSVLLARQADGTFPPFPVWDDVRTFDGRPWRGVVDVVSGGFPCQDISAAGRGDGLDGERSGLWLEMARIIGEVRPRFAFVENSPMLTSRGLGRVLGDLAALGFDADWGVVGADDCGAPHQRERIWILAHAQGVQRNGRADHAGSGMEAESFPQPRDGSGAAHLADAGGEHEQGIVSGRSDAQERGVTRNRPTGSRGDGFGWWESEPGLGRVADGVAYRADRLKSIGNGQVPRVRATAWRILMESA